MRRALYIEVASDTATIDVKNFTGDLTTEYVQLVETDFPRCPLEGDMTVVCLTSFYTKKVTYLVVEKRSTCRTLVAMRQ